MTGIAVTKNHLTLSEVKMKVQMTAGSLKIRKWLVIYNVIIDPRPVSEIALHTGFSETSVQRIIAEYDRIGPEAIEKSNTLLGSGMPKLSKKGQENEQECTEDTHHRLNGRTESQSSEAHRR